MMKRDIYKESYFKRVFPKLYKECKEILKDEKVYFGNCYQSVIYDDITVLYNFEEDEDRSALFVFSNKQKLIAHDLNLAS
jgi:hypothetical protein